MTFQIGDKVEWLTRTPGAFTYIQHVGTVVGVVPAGVLPRSASIFGVRPIYPYSNLRLPCKTAVPRNHESYIVHVPGTGRGQGKLYWPRVSGLRRCA